jgi:hypothetical protein
MIVLNQQEKASLNEAQKKKINALLMSDQRTPGNVTIGDKIKKRLKLSDDEFNELNDEIENYIVSFFDNLLEK